MPLDLAQTLVQAALALKKGVIIDFETVLGERTESGTIPRVYTNFRQRLK